MIVSDVTNTNTVVGTPMVWLGRVTNGLRGQIPAQRFMPHLPSLLVVMPRKN